MVRDAGLARAAHQTCNPPQAPHPYSIELLNGSRDDDKNAHVVKEPWHYQGPEEQQSELLVDEPRTEEFAGEGR